MDRRKILMDHFVSPTHKGLDSDSSYEKFLKSPACSDEMTIQISDDGSKIVKLAFEGQACIIATSSTDLMFEMLEGKTFDEALGFIKLYEAMILEGETPSEELGELAIFDNVHRQKGRWKCATLSTDGLKEYLNAKIPS